MTVGRLTCGRHRHSTIIGGDALRPVGAGHWSLYCRMRHRAGRCCRPDSLARALSERIFVGTGRSFELPSNRQEER
jgi:hypothetical protein